MSDLTVWQIPTMVIAENRAKFYMDEFGDDLQRSLDEDTLPLFEDDSEILDWASNNMNWSDVANFAVQIKEEREPDYEKDWCNAKKKVVSE